MLESAEVGHAISKAAYAQQEPRLREALLNAQFDLSQTKKGPVLLIISGVEGGGRSETANKLTEWMDPRHIRVMAFGDRACEELVRPPAWRYWRALPPKGRIGIFLNAWYTEIVAARVEGQLDKTGFEFYLQETRSYERMLFDEGFTVLKFWIHLSKSGLRERLHEIERHALPRCVRRRMPRRVAPNPPAPSARCPSSRKRRSRLRGYAASPMNAFRRSCLGPSLKFCGTQSFQSSLR